MRLQCPDLSRVDPLLGVQSLATKVCGIMGEALGEDPTYNGENLWLLCRSLKNRFGETRVYRTTCKAPIAPTQPGTSFGQTGRRELNFRFFSGQLGAIICFNGLARKQVCIL